MQALEIFEASLCPGCQRPIDVCAAAHASGEAVSVDVHTCTYALARTVQQRIDEWENGEPGKRPATQPTTPEWSDGRMYAPRPATPEELED